MGIFPSREASSIYMRVSGHLFAHCDLGRLGCRAVHHGRAADSPSPFGVLTAHKMPGPGATALDLAGSGNLDSLFQPLVGLLFRHLTTSLKRIHKHSMLCCLPTQVNIIPPIWPKISQNPFWGTSGQCVLVKARWDHLYSSRAN